MIETVTTEWSDFEVDRAGNRIRFLGQHTRPTGPRARILARYIRNDPGHEHDGWPICIEEAMRDADGWFVIVPGSLECRLDSMMRFEHVQPHPRPKYAGSLVQVIVEREA